MVDNRIVWNWKKITKFDDGVDEWFTLLIFNFKKPFTMAIDSMLHEKYIMKNAVNRREPREFIQKIFDRPKIQVSPKPKFN